MKAMIVDFARRALVQREVAMPVVGARQVLVRVEACGVCRTDLHVIDGDLPHPKSNVIPGHEVVGVIAAIGVDSSTDSGTRGDANGGKDGGANSGADDGTGPGDLRIGQRVGVPWLAWTCGRCAYCASGRENLCDNARFTGYSVDGGYAEYVVADRRYCFTLPDGDASSLAPWLCAGLIGYRSLRMAGDPKRLGIYGFGAAAHIVAQVARHEGREVYAFTREGDTTAQDFARSLGATWAGASSEAPPEELDAAIVFASVGALVPQALRSVAKGGSIVCGGIHMSDIPSFPYEWLWGERRIVSVANLTRNDGIEFVKLATRIPIVTSTTDYRLEQANQAVDDLRRGSISGAAVLVP